MKLIYPTPRPVIHRGDSLPPVVLVAEGVTIDPAGATVTASLFRLGTGEIAVETDLTASISPTGSGSPWTITLTLAADDIPTETETGQLAVRFRVEFTSDSLTLPADDSLVLVLTGEVAAE